MIAINQLPPLPGAERTLGSDQVESIIKAMNDRVAELRRDHPGDDIPSRQSVRYAARQLLKGNHGPINAVMGKIVLVMQDRDLGRPVKPHRSGGGS